MKQQIDAKREAVTKRNIKWTGGSICTEMYGFKEISDKTAENLAYHFK